MHPQVPILQPVSLKGTSHAIACMYVGAALAAPPACTTASKIGLPRANLLCLVILEAIVVGTTCAVGGSFPTQLIFVAYQKLNSNSHKAVLWAPSRVLMMLIGSCRESHSPIFPLRSHLITLHDTVAGWLPVSLNNCVLVGP